MPGILTNSSITNDERESALHLWFEGIEYVGNITHGNIQKDVRKMIRFINEQSNFAVPAATPEGKWGVRRWIQHKNGFCITVLFDSDSAINDYFAKLKGRPSYQEEPRTIFLPNDDITRTWRGILLYHELLHAYYHAHNLTRGHPETHWVEEYNIYLKEIAVIKEIYGVSNNHFTDNVKSLAERFEESLRTNKLTLNPKKELPEDSLEKIIGPSRSPLEQGSKRGVLILHALYIALDRIHTDGKKDEHYAITKWFYSVADKRKVTET